VSIGFAIARIITVILLFWALDRHPYGYYKLLRFVVCSVTVYGTYFSAKLEKIGWVWTFGIIAILFNPLIPIYLGKGTWQIIDLAVGILLLISIFVLRKSQSGQVDEDPKNEIALDKLRTGEADDTKWIYEKTPDQCDDKRIGERENHHKARVFIVDQGYKADYKVYFVDQAHQEKNAALIAGGELVKYEHQANAKVYIVNREYQADIKITRKNFPS